MVLKKNGLFPVLFLLLPWVFPIDKKAVNLEKPPFTEQKYSVFLKRCVKTRFMQLEAILIIMSIKWYHIIICEDGMCFMDWWVKISCSSALSLRTPCLYRATILNGASLFINNELKMSLCGFLFYFFFNSLVSEATESMSHFLRSQVWIAVGGWVCYPS